MLLCPVRTNERIASPHPAHQIVPRQNERVPQEKERESLDTPSKLQAWTLQEGYEPGHSTNESGSPAAFPRTRDTRVKTKLWPECCLAHPTGVPRTTSSRRLFFYKIDLQQSIPAQIRQLILTLVVMTNTLTDLCGDWILQNNFVNTVCEIRHLTAPVHWSARRTAIHTVEYAGLVDHRFWGVT